MAEPESRPRPRLIRALEARRAQHRSRGLLFRLAFAFAGMLILLVGLVMLVTPGPAFVLIPVGLAMLGMEFRWAQRALDRALERAYAAQQKAARTSRTLRRVAILCAVLAIAALLGVAMELGLVGI